MILDPKKAGPLVSWQPSYLLITEDRVEMWHVLGVWQEHTWVIAKALDPVQVSCFYRVGRARIAPPPIWKEISQGGRSQINRDRSGGPLTALSFYSA